LIINFTLTILLIVALIFPTPFSTLVAPPRSEVAQRDTNGKIKRSASEKRDFRRDNPCPATGRTKGSCPGYVIDHVIPLKRGGADRTENMQWQTIEEAKEKDKWE